MVETKLDARNIKYSLPPDLNLLFLIHPILQFLLQLVPRFLRLYSFREIAQKRFYYFDFRKYLEFLILVSNKKDEQLQQIFVFVMQYNSTQILNYSL